MIFFLFPVISYASTGTIGVTTNAAWSDQTGWVNFAPTNGATYEGVYVSDSALTGSAWSQNYGWINFAPSHGGVTNDGQGHLGGTAWGDNIGWISFSGVTMNTTTGKFSGSATGPVIGTLTFDCSECDVATDWRPASSQSSGGGSTGSTGSSGSGGVPINPTPTPAPTPTPTPEPTPSPTPEPTPTPTSEPTPTPAPTPTPTPEPTPSPTTQPSGSPSPVMSELESGIAAFYHNAPSAIKNAINAAKKFVETRTGSALTKTISTIGVITGLSLPITVAATSFSDVWLIIIRMFGFFLEAFGLRKKNRSWGTVYDSITKRPLDPVYVALIDIGTGKQVASAITDIDGRYGFLVLPASIASRQRRQTTHRRRSK